MKLPKGENITLIDLNKLFGYLHEQHQYWVNNSEMLAREASDLLYDEQTARTYWNEYHFSNGFERAYEELLVRFEHEYYQMFFPNFKDL